MDLFVIGGSTSFLRHFRGSNNNKEEKKDKNMISCTRLYAKPIEALVGQANEMIPSKPSNGAMREHEEAQLI